jgi:hypothetical protein
MCLLTHPLWAQDGQFCGVINTSVFSQETLGVPGNSNRLFFSGPGTNNFDMALHKVTPITERVSLEFRAEFFNAFNHAQFQLRWATSPPATSAR